MKQIIVPAVLSFAGIILMVSCRQSAAGYLAKGNQLYQAEKYEEAILNYRKAIQKDQRFGEAHYRLGLAAFKIHDTRTAYSSLTSAHQLLPGRADVQATLADLLLLAYLGSPKRPPGFYSQLTNLSHELMAQDPNSYDGLRINGNLAWTDGRLKEAEQFFTKANAARPMMPSLILSWVQVLFKDGQPAEGERLALELIKTRKDAAQIYDLLYLHYRDQSRLTDAENILRTKVDNNPGQMDYAVELAVFYAAAGKRDQMTAALHRLLDDPKTFPSAHLKVGDFYGALHEWPEALRQYQEGAKADPKDKTTYLRRIANAWLAQGKGDQAAGVVGEILKERPNDEAAKAVNASLLLKAGRPETVQAGVNDLEAVVKKEPDNPLWRFALGQALLAQGDQSGAIGQFRESLRKRPKYLPSILALAELSLSQRDYSQTLQYANGALSVNPRLEGARLLRTAALMGVGNNTQARAELTRLAVDLPQNTEIQFQLAALDMADKKFPQAEARLQKLYEKDKFRAVAGLVEAYGADGQMEKAISRLNLELGKSRNTAWVHSLLAETYMRAGKYDSAIDQCQRLQLLGDHSAQLQMRAGTVYQLKGDLDKALASFEAAKELAPRDPAVFNALADVQQMTGRKQEAIVNYRRLLALDSENANAQNNLAYVLLETGGAPDEAQRLVEHALQKAPKNPNFADTLGMVYLKKNLQDSAVQIFSGLTQRFPDNPVFLYHYAISLSQKGQRSKAKMELELALHKSPPDTLRKSIQSSLTAIQQ